MSAGPGPDFDAQHEPPPSRFGLIMAAAIIGTMVVWTYIFFGMTAIGWWGKGAATVIAVVFLILTWRWRRQRERTALTLLQRWAEKDDAPPIRPRRG